MRTKRSPRKFLRLYETHKDYLTTYHASLFTDDSKPHAAFTVSGEISALLALAKTLNVVVICHFDMIYLINETEQKALSMGLTVYDP